ncbi:MAG: TadE family type IV pilus minor pilin [Leifsonia sp.]
MRCRWGERGSVTAEFAVAFPAVALTLAACLGGVQVVGLQVRLTDAAADAARSAARGDEAAAGARAAAAVPGAGVVLQRDGDLVCALARAPAAQVGVLSAIMVSARACAIDGGL